jgi:LPXTG-site transpeptidase (sortase) family protein
MNIIYSAKTNLKKIQLKKSAYLLFSLSFLSLVFLALTPLLSQVKSNSVKKPSTPNYFGLYLNKSLDWETLNDFKLIIPKLDLNADVSPSIDLLNPKSWQSALKKGLAHAQNSSLPNQPGTTYIFGHSTDYPWNIQTYNALLYSLNDLELNDQIFISYQKEPYRYRVTDKQVIKADDLSYLNSNNQNRLVLQTCWPPGTTLKRLVVVATSVDN